MLKKKKLRGKDRHLVNKLSKFSFVGMGALVVWPAADRLHVNNLKPEILVCHSSHDHH